MSPVRSRSPAPLIQQLGSILFRNVPASSSGFSELRRRVDAGRLCAARKRQTSRSPLPATPPAPWSNCSRRTVVECFEDPVCLARVVLRLSPLLGDQPQPIVFRNRLVQVE